MHIVFISWWWPYPANNGSRIRIYHLLRHLARRHRLTLLSFAEHDEATPEQMEHMLPFCHRVEIVPKPAYHPNAPKSLFGYFSRWPRSLVSVYSQPMEAILRSVVQSSEVDVIVASQLQTMRYLEAVPNTPAVMEEAELTGFHDRFVHAATAVERFRARLTQFKFERTLRTQLTRGVAFTVASEAEFANFSRFAPEGSRLEIIPNGVDTQGSKYEISVRPSRSRLIYTGAVTYDANLDAVRYFVREILPRLRNQVPDIELIVTGATGGVDVRELAAHPGVTFSGYLDSVAQAVRESLALVVPLRIGGGTRLKILEAMALGTPVISTRKGAEGLKVTPGRNILLADTPEEIADAVLRLLADAPLRTELISGGRALVEREYDWESIGERLTRFIEAVAKQP